MRHTVYMNTICVSEPFYCQDDGRELKAVAMELITRFDRVFNTFATERFRNGLPFAIDLQLVNHGGAIVLTSKPLPAAFVARLKKHEAAFRKLI